jgi:hypothetical protein
MITVQNFLDNLRTRPVVGPALRFADQRPRLAAWIVLSLGIVILLIIEARDVGLLIGQWIALIVASVLVAGLCIWIVTWEDSEEEPGSTPSSTTGPTTTSTGTPADQPKS